MFVFFIRISQNIASYNRDCMKIKFTLETLHFTFILFLSLTFTFISCESCCTVASVANIFGCVCNTGCTVLTSAALTGVASHWDYKSNAHFDHKNVFQFNCMHFGAPFLLPSQGLVVTMSKDSKYTF